MSNHIKKFVKAHQKDILTVTDLGEGGSQPYKPLNVKHEKLVSYLQPILFVGLLNILNLDLNWLFLGLSVGGPLNP